MPGPRKGHHAPATGGGVPLGSSTYHERSWQMNHTPQNVIDLRHISNEIIRQDRAAAPRRPDRVICRVCQSTPLSKGAIKGFTVTSDGKGYVCRKKACQNG